MLVFVFYDREDPSATPRFDVWRRLNPHGFYASRRGRRWMLHRAWCRHMYEPGTARTAAAEKVCSLDRSAVEHTLLARGTQAVACKDCAPRAATPPSTPRPGPSVELPPSLGGDAPPTPSSTPPWPEPELGAVEGELRRRLVRDRYREGALRDAKVATAIAASPDGRLRCEVPRCGFDFAAVYAALGAGYAEVHHLRPLAEHDEPRLTTLDDLAVVCANCHAMIHRGGECRPLEALIPNG
jgi:hypothetical protein